MLVYGDASFEADVAQLTESIRLRVTRQRRPTLDQTRAVLVAAGQLEQALEDAPGPPVPEIRTLTRVAAEAFVRVSSGLASPDRGPELLWILGRVEAAVGARQVRVRVPEGFAWYALYPDAYAQTASGWLRALAPGTRVLVIGLRSIGTSLAAVVSAVLRAHGVEARDITLRPEGPPFERRACLPSSLAAVDRVVVVDEGPGLSGSSMVAVARALLDAGLGEQSISFFPGHGNGPGPMGTREARALWGRIQYYVTPLERVRLGQEALLDVLKGLAAAVLGEAVDGEPRDIGAGHWQSEAGAASGRTHALAPPFEQPKYLVRGKSGEAVLLKYAGIAAAAPGDDGCLTLAERTCARLGRLADRGLTVAPQACAHGWLAIPWLHGRPLQRSDADASTIERIGRFIASASGPRLGCDERTRSLERLAAILTTNVPELLGPDRVELPLQSVRAELASGLELPSYGDGRLAPHEWVRTPDGQILKVDAGGHEQDHTIVGPQSILWDIAGAIVEWDLSEESSIALVSAAGFPRMPMQVLSCYGAAYAAFRGGMAYLSAGNDMSTLPVAFYRNRLQTELARLETGA